MSAPHSANAIAAAWPIPLVPPVTTAVWPSRENIENAEVAAMFSIVDLKSDILILKAQYWKPCQLIKQKVERWGWGWGWRGKLLLPSKPEDIDIEDPPPPYIDLDIGTY